MTLIGAIKTDSTPKINIQTFPENRKIGKIIDPQNVATLNKLINKRVIILLWNFETMSSILWSIDFRSSFIFLVCWLFVKSKSATY